MRCNQTNDIGFVKNSKRMCVAISRMKMRMTIVGSKTTLCTNANWAKLSTVSKFVSDIDEIPVLPSTPDLPIDSRVSKSCSVSSIMACPTIVKELQRKSYSSFVELRNYKGRGRGRVGGRVRGGGR